MSDNKFIKRLKGEQTAKSVLEIKNESAKTSFANMPQGTSNAINVFSDHRGNATAVLEGTDIWKLNNSQFVVVPNAFGDGRDFTSTYTVAGSTLWVNATYTFDQPKIFTGATQWTLKLCGHSLLSSLSNTIGFSLIIKFGSAVTITKSFSVSESAFEFCKEFIIDFSESEQSAIKVANGDTMTVQLLCADATASATIYNGMTTLVAQQRRVDGEAVASDLHTFEDLEVEVAQIQDDIVQIHEDIDDLEEYVDNTFVRLDGTSIMTAPLKFMSGSFRGAVGPYLNGVSFWKMDAQGAITNYANFTDSTFWPVTTNAIDLGRSANKWKDLYLAGKAYMSVINNGYDIAIPVTNSADTLALKSEVDLAANSGRMITDQGVWYAKMYAATVAPSAEDSTNYADFSQTDGQGNPIIVIYERQSGAWVQSETITPPAEYDGYVPITSKIWDITEQAGQQGGRILWNHQSKEFTPYPQIISFEDIEVTGNSTVIMPQNPSASQIVNKDYVDNKVSSSIGNGTITLTQSGNTMGTFTTNQSGDTTIALDGGSSYHPDLFDWKWADHQLNDVQWLRADTFSWQSGSTYRAAYKHLRNDMYNWYSWTNNGTTIYTKKAYPEVGEKVYSDSALTTEVGEITDVTDTLDITVEKITVNSVVYDSVTGSNIAPTTETVAGVTVQYIPAEDGHKIVTDFHESEVADVYTATGEAWYYIIDYGFKRFKLPRRHSQQIVRSVKNADGSWYRLYADGWVEQGGQFTLAYSGTTVTLPIELDNTGYVPTIQQRKTSVPAGFITSVGYMPNTTTITMFGNWSSGDPDNPCSWQVSGQSAIDMSSFQDGEKHLYFYVGNFTQTAIENTAGLNTELFNEKADLDLANVLANIDFVVERQEPTAANNYTWYRKYRSGWVEQGGLDTAITGSWVTVTLPITMQDANYVILGNSYTDELIYTVAFKSKTQTGFQFSTCNHNGSSYGKPIMWQVSGMASS